MAISTSALSGSELIRPNVRAEAIDGLFTKTPLINTFRGLGRLTPAGGSSPVKWNYVYATDVAASPWTENQTMSNFGGPLFVQASQAMNYGKKEFGVTDFQVLNEQNGGLYQATLPLAEAHATSVLLKYFEDIFCGSGASVGISSLISATGTAHGVNQSTYAGWASIQNTCSGSSFVTVMDDTWSDLIATNADLNSVVVFMSPAVATIYQGSVASNMRGMYGQSLDIGKFPAASGLTFNGRPIVVIPGASSTELYFVDMSKASIVAALMPTSKDVPVANLGVNKVVVASMALILEDRACHAKVTQIDLRA